MTILTSYKHQRGETMKNKGLCFGLFLIITAVIVFGQWNTAYAVPAAPGTNTYIQPNGAAFTGKKIGDEYNHWTVTEEGYTVILDDASGYWYYATKDPLGNFVKSELKAGIDVPKGIIKGLRSALTFPKRSGGILPKKDQGILSPPIPTTGTQPVLVILVEFTDRAFIFTSHGDWNDLMFQTTNSVAHYYKEVSNNQLIFEPANETSENPNDGVVAVKLSMVHPGTDGITEIARQAIAAADPYVDFTQYDLDGNFHLSADELHIIIIAAGFEEAIKGSCGPAVWAQRGSLSYTEAPAPDGITVGVSDSPGCTGNKCYGGFVIAGELHAKQGSCGAPNMATIGVIAHELGHDIFLPDEYDTQDANVASIGMWGLMGAGCWNKLVQDGDSPAHLNAWDKSYQGWLTPVVIEGQVVNVAQVETSNTVYQVLNNPTGVDWSFESSSGTGEYFLIETGSRWVMMRGCPVAVY